MARSWRSEVCLPPFVLGEKHIISTGSWVACAGQDNTDSSCIVGTVPTILNGNANDHGEITTAFQSKNTNLSSFVSQLVGPYEGVYVGSQYCT